MTVQSNLKRRAGSQLAWAAPIALLMTVAAPGARASEMRAKGACTESEQWSLGRGLDARSRSEFEKLLQGESSPERGYAHARALEISGRTDEARLLGTYWKGTALLKANLVHLAFESFGQAAAAFPSSATLGVQTAAVECLTRLKLANPGLEIPDSVTARLPEFFALGPQPKQPFSELAIESLLTSFEGGQATRESMAGRLSLLRGTGAYESLAQGLSAAAAADHRQTIASMETFLKAGSYSPLLKKQLNPARQLLARAYYSVREFEQAAASYRRIDRSSNLFAETLSELAWAHLLDESYSDAIGIATNVQVGSLRNTFVPEAPMVMAMSLNELCQYQDALRSIHAFQAEYRPSYAWLKNWSQGGSRAAQSLYPLALGYLTREHGQSGAVPDRVASEWIKSNTFISLQEEISLSFKEDRALKRLSEKVTDAKSDFRGDKQADLAAALGELETRLGASRLANARLRETRVARINQNLNEKSKQMLTQLDEIAENTKLIQVEIFNGASHDIIWQNAHPDFHDVSRKWKREDKQAQSASRVWDWGRIRKSGAKVELWEDEMGAFKASLFDNCSNKERYLALRTADAK